MASKAIRLARYLKEFVGLRTNTVRDVSKYESVLWLGDMPQEPECVSPAWNDDFQPGDAWLTVHKQQFPKPPTPPDLVLPWIDSETLKRATPETPTLRPIRLMPDLSAEVEDGNQAPLVEQRLEDCPDVAAAYDKFRPNWEAWSKEYRRRERIQNVYAELFRLHTQLQKQGEIVELVLGLGLLAWRSVGKEGAIPILRHIVSARIDLHFDPTAGVMRVECSAEGAQMRVEDDMLEIESRPERSHYSAVNEQLAAIDDDIWDRPSTFAALKSWAGALHPDSEWSPELKPSLGAGTKPMVSFAPALILRKRNQVGMVRVFDAIIRQLDQESPDIPRGWLGLLDDQDDMDETTESSEPDADRTDSNFRMHETYFPLPTNREQRRIVEAIAHRRGVLVQGPPGTGKSHTIANLVCHLLATGNRVLITAETGRALQVLKDKLPEEIQPLCVSLLGQSSDSFSELNRSVQGITSRFASWRPGAYDGRISEAENELSHARRSLAKIDDELRSLRCEETYPHSVLDGSYHGTASAIAQRVSTERQQFGWLQLPSDTAELPSVDETEILRWLGILKGYNDAAVNEAMLWIPSTDQLPNPSDFESFVRLEKQTREARDRQSQFQSHAAYNGIRAQATERLDLLAGQFRSLKERRKELDRFGYSWIASLLASSLSGRQASWHALLKQSEELIGQIDRSRAILGTLSVAIKPERDLRTVLSDAKAVAAHLHGGGKWTSLGVFTPKNLKSRLYLKDEITVDGQPAASEELLGFVCAYLDMTLALRDLDGAWEEYGGLPTGSQISIRLAAIKEQISALFKALAYVEACQKAGDQLAAAIPSIPEPDWSTGQLQLWLDVIEASASDVAYVAAQQRVSICLSAISLDPSRPGVHRAAIELRTAIERRDVAAYHQSYDRVLYVKKTREDQESRSGIERKLQQEVPGFVEAVTATIDEPAWITRFTNWHKAWAWGFTDNWLRKRADIGYQQMLWRQRAEAESTISTLLAEIAGLRAWTHFFGRLSSKESAALKGWREAVKAIGKGTGRSAKVARLRLEARKYMDQCREAIPVWIMPRYLVAEMVDPAPGRYNTVIVDEASQLGVESLFLFYIAEKTIIVGDDQQISPYGVGIADAAVSDLQHHFLEGIPHHNALSAQSSLYANAKIRFGENIVLREHFRCMPEIIQFSNDLCYASNGTPLDPLRSYPANRLKPLVLRHLKDGYRSGGSQSATNEPEAAAIVAQILACIADPRYRERTIGVISLQGDAQARLIERMLLEQLEPEVIEERRLICGDAYAFQGDERNIIFLSMVAAPNERIGTLAGDSARQRFNVAASRAQDQLWLFHSVGLDLLSPACMRYRLLSYMMNPTRLVDDGRIAKFDSQFERDVFNLITERGFRVSTQIIVGDPTNSRYRIDLVVEGMQGRLAVECDGDFWHGADRFEHDMARQRDLERAGWQFFRIRGGDFYCGPERALEPLWEELTRLGIRPGGADESAAEPPPPLTEPQSSRKETDEIVSNPMPHEQDLTEGLPLATDTSTNSVVIPEANNGDPSEIETPPSNFAPYISFSGPLVGQYPRVDNTRLVAEDLCRIIDIEGPMLAKRAYDIYLRSCGIKRMGGELKSALNKALTVAVRQNRVVVEDEMGKNGLLFSIVRSNGCVPVKLRRRGPRTLEEIPPSEIQLVARQVSFELELTPGSDEHLRALLEAFELKRLTTQAGSTLLETLEKRFLYVDELLSDKDHKLR